MYVCMYMYMLIYMYIYVYVYICTDTYTYNVHIHIKTIAGLIQSMITLSRQDTDTSSSPYIQTYTDTYMQI